jgi:hypothetical protein
MVVSSLVLDDGVVSITINDKGMGAGDCKG